MPSATAAMPTRAAVFEPLLALASARIVALIEAGEIDREDGEFLLRGLIELASDGVELFGSARPADEGFYEDVTSYLVARVGPVAAELPLLARTAAETIAALATAEGDRVAQLLGLSGSGLVGRQLDRAVTQLIEHPLEGDSR